MANRTNIAENSTHGTKEAHDTKVRSFHNNHFVVIGLSPPPPPLSANQVDPFDIQLTKKSVTATKTPIRTFIPMSPLLLPSKLLSNALLALYAER